MPACEAPEILSRESYWEVRRTAKDEGNEAGGYFCRQSELLGPPAIPREEAGLSFARPPRGRRSLSDSKTYCRSDSRFSPKCIGIKTAAAQSPTAAAKDAAVHAHCSSVRFAFRMPAMKIA